MLRILLTGGGSGGHVYPLLAVADALGLQKVADAHGVTRDLDVKLSYIGPRSSFNTDFREKEIRVYHIVSVKLRRYFSLGNFADVPKFFVALIQALGVLYRVMPDVVFSKGGTSAFPVVLAARFYFIPVVIHESDAVPGLTNRLSAHFAKRVAVSFEEALRFFPAKKTAITGRPIRKELLNGILPQNGAKERFHFNLSPPLVLVLGGSQGAASLNDFVLSNLPSFVKEFQILHQTGPSNAEDVSVIASQALTEVDPALTKRYRMEAYLDPERYRDALTAADIVISRSGSSVFEFAAFGKPALLVPLESSANNHQREDAVAYAKSGAAIVFEKENFTFHVVLQKMKEILNDKAEYARMANAARLFAKTGAAEAIAEEVVKIGLRIV